MAILRIVRTGQRNAFDIVEEGPDYHVRHMATAVYVHYNNVVESARLRTYANDPRPFGPTLRHYRNISERVIDRFNLQVGQELQCDFVINPDGSHHFIILG